MSALRSLRARVQRLEHAIGPGRRMETLQGFVLASFTARSMSADEREMAEYSRLADAYAATQTADIPLGSFGCLAQLIRQSAQGAVQ